MKRRLILVAATLLLCLSAGAEKMRGVVIYPSDIMSVGVGEWENRIRESGINLVGIHAATLNEPLDTLKAFVKSKTGRQFLRMCRRNGVDVEYELHVLQLLLPREQFDRHPEYFRMNEAGERCRNYNMCFTSDDAYAALEPQLKDMLKWMHPTTHRYFLWTDDVVGTFCQCPDCRGFSPSDQALYFENRLLAMIRKHDRKATLAHLAYQQTMAAPVKVKPAEGIFLEFAPINRNYSEPLPQSSIKVLEDNLKVFPSQTLHILEYWLDESMFSKWKRNSLVKLPFNEQDCRRDIESYRSFGPESITCFATWLNANYVKLYGPADEAFCGYGNSFE